MSEQALFSVGEWVRFHPTARRGPDELTQIGKILQVFSGERVRYEVASTHKMVIVHSNVIGRIVMDEETGVITRDCPVQGCFLNV